MGPNTEIFYYENKPKIAVPGYDYARPNALMLSVGISNEAVFPLSHKFQLESFLMLPVLSLGVRSVDSDEDDQQQTKLLTMFPGLDSDFGLGVRLSFTDDFQTRLGNNFNLPASLPGTRLCLYQTINLQD